MTQCETALIKLINRLFTEQLRYSYRFMQDFEFRTRSGTPVWCRQTWGMFLDVHEVCLLARRKSTQVLKEFCNGCLWEYFYRQPTKFWKSNVFISTCLFRVQGSVCLVQVPSRGGERVGRGGRLCMPCPRPLSGRWVCLLSDPFLGDDYARYTPGTLLEGTPREGILQKAHP